MLGVKRQFEILDEAEIVQESEGFSNARDKINYPVPTGKILYITGWTATNREGKMQIGFRINGTTFDGAGLNEDGLTFAERSVDPRTPIATATAGQTVDAYREWGDSKSWFASIQGYLLDA